MVRLLLDAGAGTEDVAAWWADGFGAQAIQREAGEALVEAGVELSIHAAAALARTTEARALLQAQPELAGARGGDGATPLHFCRSLGVAKLLLAHGADLDAEDEDHHSTPTQWRVHDAPELVRFLLERGARLDIFVAAALGDATLLQRALTEDPDAANQRIGHNDGPFPGIGFEGRGGTILQWTVGFNIAPHQVAAARANREARELLEAHSSPKTLLLVAATSGERVPAESLASAHPQIMDELSLDDRQLLAKMCWETNKSLRAVRLMLDLGWPVFEPEPNHGWSALHNAAWCGDPELVELLLERGHPTDVRDPTHDSTAIGFALHSCLVAKRHPDGRFAEVLQLLVEAGVPVGDEERETGVEELDQVLSGSA